MKLNALTKTLRFAFARRTAKEVQKATPDYDSLSSAEIFADRLAGLQAAIDATVNSLSVQEQDLFEKGYAAIKSLEKNEKAYLLHRIYKESSLYPEDAFGVAHSRVTNNAFDVFKNKSMLSGGASKGAAPANDKPVEEAKEPEADAKKEKAVVDVELVSFDAAQKLKIVKELKSIMGLGLKESKDLLEKGAGVLKAGVSRDQAVSMQEKLGAIGCVVNLK